MVDVIAATRPLIEEGPVRTKSVGMECELDDEKRALRWFMFVSQTGVKWKIRLDDSGVFIAESLDGKKVRHLAIDRNYLSGTIHIENSKTVQIAYVNSEGNPIGFKPAPRISVMLLNATSQPIYKVNDIKSGIVYTGFVVGFQFKVTLDIEWQAFERA